MAILGTIGQWVFGLLLIFMSLNHFMNYANLKGYAAAKNVPAAGPAVLVSGLTLLLGALGLFLPWELFAAQKAVGGVLVAVFLVLTAVMIHNFWTFEDQMEKQNQMAHFLKNMVITGAVLWLAFG